MPTAAIPDDVYASRSNSTNQAANDGSLGIDSIYTGKAPILTRSFLMGYLTSCRALLECGALALGILYNLDLPIAQQRFSNTEFWRQLVSIVPNVHRRYHSMRLFFQDVDHWCAEIPLRLPPIVALYAEDGLGRMISQEMQARVLDEAVAKLDDLPLGLDHNWLDPIALHRRWKPDLVSLCERLCRDIESQTRGRLPEFGE